MTTKQELQNELIDCIRSLVGDLYKHICEHEETHRGGAIWEICDHCGEKWADDEWRSGGDFIDREPDNRFS